MLCLGPKKILLTPRLELSAQGMRSIPMINAKCDTTQLFGHSKLTVMFHKKCRWQYSNLSQKHCSAKCAITTALSCTLQQALLTTFLSLPSALVPYNKLLCYFWVQTYISPMELNYAKSISTNLPISQILYYVKVGLQRNGRYRSLMLK